MADSFFGHGSTVHLGLGTTIDPTPWGRRGRAELIGRPTPAAPGPVGDVREAGDDDRLEREDEDVAPGERVHRGRALRADHRPGPRPTPARDELLAQGRGRDRLTWPRAAAPSRGAVRVKGIDDDRPRDLEARCPGGIRGR